MCQYNPTPSTVRFWLRHWPPNPKLIDLHLVRSSLLFSVGYVVHTSMMIYRNGSAFIRRHNACQTIHSKHYRIKHAEICVSAHATHRYNLGPRFVLIFQCNAYAGSTCGPTFMRVPLYPQQPPKTRECVSVSCLMCIFVVFAPGKVDTTGCDNAGTYAYCSLWLCGTCRTRTCVCTEWQNGLRNNNAVWQPGIMPSPPVLRMCAHQTTRNFSPARDRYHPAQGRVVPAKCREWNV